MSENRNFAYFSNQASIGGGTGGARGAQASPNLGCLSL